MIPHSKPALGVQEQRACAAVIRKGFLSAGAQVEAFSEELATYADRRFAIPTSSGLAALHLSLLALGCDRQHEVYLPSYVCTALLNAINYTQATPILTDTPHHGFLMDPTGSFLKNYSREIVIYPQLFGAVTPLSFPKKAMVIEDCAMALGPTALKQGAISITSFYATKVMTTGQGGAIFTDDESLYLRLKDLMAYDNQTSYKIRYNYDMTDVEAAMGREQLKRLPVFFKHRHRICSRYDAHFIENSPSLLAFPKGLHATFPDCPLFRYWIRAANVEECIEHLANKGIEAKRPVYQPLHRYNKRPGISFPHTTQAWKSFLSLPFYPALKNDHIDQVAEEVMKVATPIESLPTAP